VGFAELQTLFINGCQFKILYVFKLAHLTSFRVKILLNYQLKKEVSWANFNNYKRIFNGQPFMEWVYFALFDTNFCFKSLIWALRDTRHAERCPG